MSLIAVLVWLLGQGFVVSQVIDLLKRIPFVASHPKLVAAVLNVVAIFAATFLPGVGAAISSFLLTVIAGLTAAAASVYTYELKKAIIAK